MADHEGSHGWATDPQREPGRKTCGGPKTCGENVLGLRVVQRDGPEKDKASQRRGTQLSISVDAMNALMNQDWPGNVRELRNVIERASSLGDGPTITRARIC